MTLRPALAWLLLAAAAPLAGVASAQEAVPATVSPAAPPPGAASGPAAGTLPAGVLAIVNGTHITQEEFDLFLADNAPPGTEVTAEIRQIVMDRLIDGELLYQAAQRTGLDQRPAVKRQIRQVLQGALLQELVEPRITEDALRAKYQEFLSANEGGGETEVRARHILLPSQPAALSALARVQGGESFEAVADELTTDPSGRGRGGDLGFFKRGMMVAPFEDAAFALEPGQITPQPVESQFGWHVIKLEERRQVAPPTFDEMRASLRQDLTGELISQVLEELRGGAEIVR